MFFLGVSSFSHDGQPISLKENDIWTDSDVDYTPYRNIISAVWPQLRYTAETTLSTSDIAIYTK